MPRTKQKKMIRRTLSLNLPPPPTVIESSVLSFWKHLLRLHVTLKVINSSTLSTEQHSQSNDKNQCFSTIWNYFSLTRVHVASLAFLAAWGGLDLGLTPHHFFPVDNSSQSPLITSDTTVALSVTPFNYNHDSLALTGMIDPLIQVALNHGMITQCFVMTPPRYEVTIQYLLIAPSGKEDDTIIEKSNNTLFQKNSKNEARWEKILNWVVCKIDPLVVPTLALVEYLSMPSNAWPWSDNGDNWPLELSISKISSRYPVMRPLFPRLVQYHDYLVQLIHSGKTTSKREYT